MIISCEECGREYDIDSSKLAGRTVKSKCLSCNNIMSISGINMDDDVSPFDDDDAGFDDDSGLDDAGGADVSDLIREKPHISGLSIRSKITMIIVLLVAVSLLVVGWITNDRSKKALLSQVEVQLSTYANQKSAEYERIFTGLNNDLSGLADYAQHIYTRDDIKTDIKRGIILPWNDATQTYGKPANPAKGTPSDAAKYKYEIYKLQRLCNIFKYMTENNPILIAAYMGTADGLMANETENSYNVISGLTAYQPQKRGWFIEAIKQKKLIWTEPYVDATTKELIISTAKPVYSKADGNTLLGVVSFDILLDTLQKDILALDIGYGGYAFMIDATGKVLVRPGIKKGSVKWNEAFEADDYTKTDNPEFNAIVKDMAMGKSGLASYVESGTGDEKYIAYSYLKVIGSSIAIVANKADILKPVVEIQKFIAFICGVVILISIIVCFIIGNNITKPLNRLTIIANLISQGKMDLEIIDEDRKDEIGVLTKSINRLVNSLKLALNR